MVLNTIERCERLLEKSLFPVPQELNELDWKQDLSGNKEKLKKHLSAFSNYAGGGFIVFGVEDKTGHLLDITSELSEKISSLISELARTGVDPAISTNFFSLNFKDHHLYVCHISESVEKPVYVKSNQMIETPFIRAGGTSRPMTREEIRYTTMNSRHLRYEEMPALLPTEIENDWEPFFDFSQIQNRLKRNSFSSKESWYEFLYNLKLLIKTDAKFLPTNLAIITAAKDFSHFPGYEKLDVRIIAYRGINKFDVKLDRSFVQGYSLCLDQLIEEIMKLIPIHEQIKSATRLSTPEMPELAIREIISNAVIHRDYHIANSRLLIEIYSNRIEVTNPGSLVSEVSIDRLIDHPSKTRNEVLADLMRNLGFAEERGSGIDKAVGICETLGLPPLRFINEQDYFKAIIYSLKPFSEMDKYERIEAVYQHACLNHVITSKTTNKSIRERFKFSDKDSTKVTRLINDVLKSKKIKLANPEATRKDYHYIPYWA